MRSRRKMAVCGLALLLFFTLCGCGAQRQTGEWFAMDTVMTAAVYGSADALDAFLSGEQGLYYGSTADAADVQTQLAGRYQLYAVQSPERACMLQNVWSVTQQSSKKETACAVRFLSYLLSGDGQRCLYLENQYPSIPVSSTVYEQYRNIAGELADVLTDAKPRPCGIA